MIWVRLLALLGVLVAMDAGAAQVVANASLPGCAWPASRAARHRPLTTTTPTVWQWRTTIGRRDTSGKKCRACAHS